MAANIDEGIIRDRYTTRAVEDTRSHGGMIITNNPTITVSNNVNVNRGRGNGNSNSTMKIIGVIIIVTLIIGAYVMFRQTKHGDKSEKPAGTRTPIKETNPETLISRKLVEITDMYDFAGCLNIKDSKATVDQFTKNHRGKTEDIRIEVIDKWLKEAEVRYWEELVEALKCVGNDKLAGKIYGDYI